MLDVLTPGVRARLPFAVPANRGVLPAPQAVVTSYLPGVRLQPGAVGADSALAGSIGRAIAAIHELPDLRRRGGAPARRDRRRLRPRCGGADRPRRLDRRGAARADQPLVRRRRGPDAVAVPAVRRARRAGRREPARHAEGGPGRPGHRRARLGRACRSPTPRGTSPGCSGCRSPARPAPCSTPTAPCAAGTRDKAITRRALLYAELEIARWLLHGVEKDDDAIASDAVQMLEALLASVLEGTAGTLVGERLPTHDGHRGRADARRPASARGERVARTARGPGLAQLLLRVDPLRPHDQVVRDVVERCVDTPPDRCPPASRTRSGTARAGTA